MEATPKATVNLLAALEWLAVIGVALVFGYIPTALLAIREIKKAMKYELDYGELEKLSQEQLDELLYFFRCMKIHEYVEVNQYTRQYK